MPGTNQRVVACAKCTQWIFRKQMRLNTAVYSMPTFPHSSMKFSPLLAELVGTFLLTLLVSVGVVAGYDLAIPVAAGLTLGLLVYSLGGVSGAHVNPAVTLGLLSVGKISASKAVLYVIAQVAGALLAAAVCSVLLGTAAHVETGDSWKILLAEALGAGVLVMAVSSVVWKKTPDDAAGLTIGVGLTLGATLASTVSIGAINPAVAVGVGALSWTYLVGPLLGGVVFAWLYKTVVTAKW